MSNMVKSIFGAVYDIENSSEIVKQILERISNFLISCQELTISGSGLSMKLTTLGLKVRIIILVES